MLLREPVDHRSEPRVGAAQVREHAAVLDRVVRGDDPAVRLAVGAEGPVVLAHRHGLMWTRAAPGSDASRPSPGRRGRAPAPARRAGRRARRPGAGRRPARGRCRSGPGRARGRSGGSSRPRPGRPAAAAVVRRRHDPQPCRAQPVAAEPADGSAGAAASPASAGRRWPRRRDGGAGRRRAAALGGDELAHGRGHLGGEPADDLRVVAHRRCNALIPCVERQLGELLGPHPAGPCRNPVPRRRIAADVVEPADRPTARARPPPPPRRSRAFVAGSASGGAYGLLGSHPSASRPVSASIRFLYAPSQIPTSCAGAGPGGRPRPGGAPRRPAPRRRPRPRSRG